MERTKNDLAMLQALPLDVKVRMTQNRIREWVREFGTSGVYVSLLYRRRRVCRWRMAAIKR